MRSLPKRLLAASGALALSAVASLVSADSELSALAERTKPSVVLLTVEDASGHKLGTGTGFFVSTDGRIVTNHHVIEGAAAVTATLADGSKRAVTGILADDADKDIAILDAEGEGFPALSLGDSNAVKPGDEVVVIGSPMGLSGTLTVGIVSAIRERGIPDEVDPGAETTRSWGIQISAALSPGSSGSPIMTRSGSVVAVAVGTLHQAQSLNFGVPIEVAKSQLEKLSPQSTANPFLTTSHNEIGKNLAISAGVLVGLVLAYLVWGYIEARPQKRRG